MFRDTIGSTPMTTVAANMFFENIHGENYGGDITFLSTLRALAYPRMEEGDRISLKFTSSSYSKSTIESNTDARVINAMLDMGYYDIKGILMIHNFYGDRDSNEAGIELIKRGFCKVYPGFHRLEKVTEFFQKTFSVMCFINPEKKQVVIFTDDMNTRKMHYLQCAIFAFMPWYFNPEDGVTADEMALIQSLRENKSDNYNACLAKLAQQYDFRSAYIRNNLAGFETRFEQLEADKVKNRISEALAKFNDLNSRIANVLNEKRDYEIKLLGLEAKIANSEGEDSEIMEYFLCNNKLSLIECNTNTLMFAVKDYVSYFDDEMAQQIIDNEHSYIYRPNGRECNNYIAHEDMKKLMSAIFIDQTLKLKFCAAYSFKLGVDVAALYEHSFGDDFSDCMPNTHIDKYKCLGNYKKVINERIRDHDYIGAIEQCIASCKSLNFGDSTVMKTFIERMYGLNNYTHNRCIELPDGRVVTPADAVAWMKEQEAPDPAEEVHEECTEATEENVENAEEHADAEDTFTEAEDIDDLFDDDLEDDEE